MASKPKTPSVRQTVSDTELHPELGLPTAVELRSCKACPLAGPGPVAGEAWGSSVVMLVGEAPGVTEARTGRPFVGESGRLLRRWLDEAGLTEVFITNVCKHRTPKNRIPTDAEVLACLPYLAREVAVIRPKVIVLVGQTAICLAFQAKGKVKKMAGRWSTLWNIPCVAMLHPAALLRMSQKERGAWYGACVSVLQQAQRQADGWTPAEVPWEWAPVGSGLPPESAFDIEATSKDQRVARPILSAACSDGLSAGVWDGLPEVPIGTDIIMHHSAYDACIMARCGLNLRQVTLDDPMVLAHTMGLYDLSLKGLSAKLLDEPIPSFADLFGDDAESVPRDVLAAYCARDAVQTHRLFNRLRETATPSDLAVYTFIEKPLLPIVAEMDAFGGFDVDQEGVRELTRQYGEELAHLAWAFAELTGEKVNIQSGDKLAWVLKEKLGLPLTKLTPSKARLSVDEASLRPFIAHHPAIGVLLRYKELHKLLTTYLAKYAELEHVSCLWWQTGARNGRFSSSGPNLQNVPPALRKYLVARPGKTFVSSDAGQIEYRVAADRSQDPGFLAAYRAGRDMHDETARMLFHLGPDAVVSEEMRRRAKVFNFGGVLFGGSSDKMLEEADKHGIPMTTSEAEAGLRRARQEHPVYYAWCETVGHEALTTGGTNGLFGRHFYLREAMTYEERNRLSRQAVNYPISGGAADIVKRAMDRAWRKLGRPIVAQVHDEITFEVGETEAEDFRAALEPILLEDNPLSVPLAWETRVGKRWKE